MAVADDLGASATLCENAADAATSQLIGLGPRPTDPAAAAQWDQQDALLKNHISVLNNLSSTMSAIIVSNALQQVWPQLQGLTAASNAAEATIKAIADVSQALVKLASIIDFGVAVVALATQPTPGNAQAVVTAFGKMIAT